MAPGRSRQARGTARSTTIPAPTGGWNTRDNIAALPPTDAVVLDNWFPSPSNIAVRKGHIEWATGLPANVETLMAYAAPDALELWAASDDSIFNVTAQGAVGAAGYSSLTSARLQYVNYGNAGDHWIFAVNGEDDPLKYDGSTWATNTLTGSGLTSSNLIHVNAHKSRLYYVEKDTLSVWYLPPLTISGAMAEFDLASIAKLGGYLVAMATWTVDGGQGSDDLAVFLTSNGEAIVYAGTDPGDPTDWLLQGVYRIARPIGRRCFMQYGGDLLVLTEEGVFQLSQAIISARATPKASISDKINPTFTVSSQTYGTYFGWQCQLYPRGTMAIFNVPLAPDGQPLTSEQYVFNTITGAWCRFTGMNAACWELLNEDLFFGGVETVYKADTTYADNDADIVADVLPAFSYMGPSTALKRFTMARPLFFAARDIEPALGLNIDFSIAPVNQTPSITPLGSSEWNVALWNVSPWGAVAAIRKNWNTVLGVGYSASLRVKVSINGDFCSLLSFDYLSEPGGYI